MERERDRSRKRKTGRKTDRQTKGETDFPGEIWVRTREGGVALPKGGKGDMLHSQLVKLGQLRGQEGRLELANQNGIISEENYIYKVRSVILSPLDVYCPFLPNKTI